MRPIAGGLGPAIVLLPSKQSCRLASILKARQTRMMEVTQRNLEKVKLFVDVAEVFLTAQPGAVVESW
jgi:hypothetical protein